METRAFPLKLLAAALAASFSASAIAAVSGVTISGTGCVGELLTGSYTGSGAAVYWYDTTNHAQPSSSTTYTPVVGDVGHGITFYVTPTGGGADVGSSAMTIKAAGTCSSPSSGSSAPPPPPVMTGGGSTSVAKGTTQTVQLGTGGPLITISGDANQDAKVSFCTVDGKTVICGVSGATVSVNSTSVIPVVQQGGNTITSCATPSALQLAPVTGEWSIKPWGPRFFFPAGVAIDTKGNVFVTDYNGIRKFDAEGNNVTPLGSGLNNPWGVAVDGSGNVFVADASNDAVKKFSSDGKTVTPLGSGFNYPTGVAVDGSGNVFVADVGGVTKISAGGNTNVLGSKFKNPRGVAVDGSGNVFVADYYNNAVKKIRTDGTIVTLLASGLYGPIGIVVDGLGNVFVADSNNNAVKKITISADDTTTVTTLGSGFATPRGMAVDGSGNVFVADSFSYAVKKLEPAVSVSVQSGCATTSATATAATTASGTTRAERVFGRAVRAADAPASGGNQVYAGETAVLGQGGTLNLRLGSLRKDGKLSGDPSPSAASFDASIAGYFTDQSSPRLDTPVERLGMSLLDAIAKDLGFPTGKLGQNTFGVVALPADAGGKVYHFRPIGEVTVAPGSPDGIFPQADATVLYRKSGVQVTLVPSAYGPDDVIRQLRKQDASLTASLRSDGSYLVKSWKGGSMLLRPSWFASGGKGFNGNTPVTLPSDPQGVEQSGGIKRYGDALGWTNLAPWSSDLNGLKQSATQLDAQASVQVDADSGDIVAKVSGKSFTLSPSYTLQTPTTPATPGWSSAGTGQLSYSGLLGNQAQTYTLR
ncbi:MAG: NHL repeat-containing protein [Sulfuricella sp.]|nr:NHL repeat-containing protein [Sulfuricella sp.]